MFISNPNTGLLEAMLGLDGGSDNTRAQVRIFEIHTLKVTADIADLTNMLISLNYAF